MSINIITLLVVISVFIIAIPVYSWCSNERYEYPGRLELAIPLKSPLIDSEANSYAWMSLGNIANKGITYLDERYRFGEKMYGRFLNLFVSYYFNYALRYYSHEIAHDYYLTIDGSPKFRVNWSDWSYFVPRYIQNVCSDSHTREEVIEKLLNMYGSRRGVYRAYILDSEVGLYQEKFNAMLVSHYIDLRRKVDIFEINSFLVNQLEDLIYILFYGNEDLEFYSKEYLPVGNDITEYVYYMDDLFDINISVDSWLTVSAICNLLSAHTINSVNSLYRYLQSGNRFTDPVRFRLSEGCLISPPNFYLFPSYRGLFVLSEVFLDLGKRGYFISIGTGLDSFGISNVGSVDRIRIGFSSYSINIPFGFIGLSLAPYLHFNFLRI